MGGFGKPAGWSAGVAAAHRCHSEAAYDLVLGQRERSLSALCNTNTRIRPTARRRNTGDRATSRLLANLQALSLV